jgi:membrane protease YdiL (CAAX protease family)
VLSLILGATYEDTDNLVVPSVIHGGYNALIFGSMYANAVL